MNTEQQSSHEEGPFYVYVIVRKDLTAEQQAVQVAHAALEAGFHSSKPQEPPNLVLLEVENEESLLRAACKLERAQVKHHVFFEPDNEVGHSALAAGPLRGKVNRAHFKAYRLYRAADTGCRRSVPQGA